MTWPRNGGTIASRYFVPYSCHTAHAVTGTVCVASACAIPDTVAYKLAPLARAPQGIVKIEHPSGIIDIDLDVDFSVNPPQMRRAALIRTARRLFQGEVLIPSRIWAPEFGSQPSRSTASTKVAA